MVLQKEPGHQNWLIKTADSRQIFSSKKMGTDWLPNRSFTIHIAGKDIDIVVLYVYFFLPLSDWKISDFVSWEITKIVYDKDSSDILGSLFWSFNEPITSVYKEFFDHRGFFDCQIFSCSGSMSQVLEINEHLFVWSQRNSKIRIVLHSMFELMTSR